MKGKKFNSDEVVAGIVDFIKEETDEDLLFAVIDQFDNLLPQSKRSVDIRILSYPKLSNEQKESINKKVSGMLNRQVKLSEIVDDTLIGGFKLQIGDFIYDASIKGQLESVKGQLYESI